MITGCDFHRITDIRNRTLNENSLLNVENKRLEEKIKMKDSWNNLYSTIPKTLIRSNHIYTSSVRAIFYV